MTRKRYELMRFGFVSLLVVGLFFGAVSLSMAKKGDVLDRKAIGEVRIFEINDLTGPTSESCIRFHEVLSDLVAEANKKGGIIYHDPKTKKLERVTIKLNFGDCKAKSGLVPMLYERLATDKPKPVVSFCGSSCCGIIGKWSERDQIPCVTGASGTNIWNPPSWMFVQSPDYPSMAAASAKWAMEDWKKKGKSGKPKWAWFTLDIPYGRAPIQPESINYITKLGFEIVGTWTVPFSPLSTITELRAIKNAGANYCYGHTTVAQDSIIMRDLTKLGLKDQLTRIATHYVASQHLVDLAGPAANGLVGNSWIALPSEMDKPGVREASELAKRNNRLFNTDYLMGWGWCRSTIIGVEKALKNKGYPITGADVYEALQDPEGFDLGGVMNIKPFTKNETRGVWKVYMREIKDGKVVKITEEFEIPDMRPGGPWTPKK